MNLQPRSVIMLLSATLLLSMVSCSDEQENEMPQSALSAEAITANAEADLVSDQIDDMVTVAVSSDFSAAKSAGSFKEALPTCATVTTTDKETHFNRIIDFGEGCELPNGILLSGSIIADYTIDMNAGTAVIEVGFDGFKVNDRSVTGEKRIEWQQSNEAQNPQADVITAVKVTWPNEFYVEVSGDVKREWIAGYDTEGWEDNVIEVTGNRDVVNSLDGGYALETLTALRREGSCRHFVSGQLAISKNLVSGVLDFGEGACDNKAVLTSEGGA
ncbi:hypothetical protein [Robertkochia aurantiaca]|uniref:hypothetical protein n=1 Tax=Robertkochia aurantiaca TaxID=2873700 RepID=UPI001CCFC130|nr:hypothetical protein [Robertkochia sp. 3YJGBD-33]